MTPFIKIEAKDIDAIVANAGSMPKQIRSGIVWSINRVGDQAFTKVRRTVAKQFGVSQRAITEGSRGLKRFRASERRLAYDIVATGKFTPLSYFEPRVARQRGRGGGRAIGVSARPWGNRRTFRGTFLATMPSGHVGVFKRVPGSRRIAELWGPSLPRELLRGETPQQFRDTFAQNLPNTLTREINRRLDMLRR